MFMRFARKIYKIPEFYMIFARKMPEFYIIIAQKIFFSDFWGARGPTRPPAPVSYAYVWRHISSSLILYLLARDAVTFSHCNLLIGTSGRYQTIYPVVVAS